VQSTAPPSMFPHYWLALALAAGAQTLPSTTLQYRPMRPSQRLPPSARPHEAPTVVANGRQVPSVVAVFPMQVRPGPQAELSLQDPEAPTGVTHSSESALHNRPGPQALLAQEVPTTGVAAHTPQELVFGIRQ
jgi:hypothetical protein